MNADSQIDEDFFPTKIALIDQSPRLVEAWKREFSRFADVEAICGDFFQRPADAMVSPANSFGIMDGGLDAAITDRLGPGVQGRLQDVIVDRYHGELPIGCAEVVETRDERWPYLIAAPTMRIPESAEFTINAYLAFRAILIAAQNFNRGLGERRIDSLVCPGLCTGIGRMPPHRCAGQMRMAYWSVSLPAVIGRFESIHEFHRTLRSL